MLTLRIELLSPLCTGSGTGRAGYVDREVTFDELGLPFIPGRALKGVLRDAYRQLDTIVASGASAIEDLFGKPGEEFAGRVRIGNARLVGYERLRSWLRGVYAKYGGTIYREDVIAYYSEVRRQTAIDRETGSPRQDTLRATRVLRRGLIFEAPIHGELREPDRRGLALAAAALRQMGTARTRGLGEVSCSIYEGDKNLTQAYLKQLTSNPPAAESSGEIVGGVPPRETPAAAKSQPQELSLLRFRVRLLEPTLLPALEGDANTVVSADYVPGSTIRGLLARRFGSPIHPDFAALFLTGEVKFLPAFLALSDSRCLPIPHSIRQDKDEAELFYDFAREIPDRPARRVAGWCCKIPVSGGWRAETMRTLHYHHARAKDPRIGRAVGERAGDFDLDPAHAGQVFTYEALIPEQTFEGAVVGPLEKLSIIRGLIEDGDTVWLGRSRSAQYGRATWSWIQGDPVPIDGRLEAQNWAQKAPEEFNEIQSGEEGEKFAVILLSPLLAQNEAGHPEAKFPTHELAEALGLATGSGVHSNSQIKHELAEALGLATGVSLELKASFVRTVWTSGYLGHQRLPRQQVPAIAAGSVFVFKSTKPLSSRALQNALCRSYGMRQEDGFGRLSIFSIDTLCKNPNLPLCSSKSPDCPSFNGNNDPARHLALHIFRRKVAEQAALEALQAADKLSRQVGKVSNHVLSRVAGLVARTDLNELPTELEKFREKARGQLEAVRSQDDSLWDRLRFQEPKKCDGNWREVYRHFVRDCWNLASQMGGRSDWPSLFRQHDPIDLQPDEIDLQPDEIDLQPDEAVVKDYLLLLLASLRRAQKRQTDKEARSGAA